MERGTAVHYATEFDDNGSLDPASVHPTVAGYLESYRRWKAQHSPRFTGIEVEVVHQIWGYAGRIDRVGTVVGSQKRPLVIDIKSGAEQPWHQIQLALYKLAWESSGEVARVERMAIYLDKDGGPPRVRVFTDRRDMERAAAVITVAKMIKERDK